MNHQLKIKYLTYAVAGIELIVLFLFPEPERNFLAYIGTAALFVALIALLIAWQKK